MRFNRRGFITSTAALAAGQASESAFAQQQKLWDGREPITREVLDALLKRKLTGEFTCVVTPQATEGPYYYQSSERRRDVTEGRRGVPLRLGIRIADASNPGGSCAPLSGAVVDIWHADADGIYSNVGDDLQNTDTVGQTFMRGHQVTDETGYVEFDTVVPGWELVTVPAPINVIIRATHIHVKVFHEFQITTAQLYFPDNFIDSLYAEIEPYSMNKQMTAPGAGRFFDRIRNEQDRMFVEAQATPMAVQQTSAGVSAQATIGLISMGVRGTPPLFR